MANEHKKVRLPYYPWYVADYRASRRVKALSITQRGIYRELLDECWLKGFIPDDVIELASICAISASLMQRHWPTVRKMFDELPGLDGHMLTNERLESERAQLDRVRAAQTEGGRVRQAKLRDTFRSPTGNLSYQSRPDQNKAVTLPDAAPPTPHGVARLSEVAPAFMEAVRRSRES